ncbi:glycosyltransferase family 2 protein [Microbacterium schleiferi]|nr:glycosyltransferase [Microbacterium schleiferi]
MSSVIDVMLPYYGDVEQMKAAVDSVMMQSSPHWRLVVIDDGYPDEEPARWFASIADARVVYLRNEQNLGANGNYRKAVELVESSWFVMMGADDIMAPDYLHVVNRAIQSSEADIIQPGVRVIDENDAVVRPLADRVKRLLSLKPEPGGSVLGGETLVASLLRANWAYFPSIAWRTSSVREVGFRPDLDVAQDLGLILDILARGGRMMVLPDVIFEYRRHTASDSSVRALDGRRFDEERRFFDGEARRFSSLGWNRASRAARWHFASRLNAASLVPKAITRGGAVNRLVRHVFA